MTSTSYLQHISSLNNNLSSKITNLSSALKTMNYLIIENEENSTIEQSIDNVITIPTISSSLSSASEDTINFNRIISRLTSSVLINELLEYLDLEKISLITEFKTSFHHENSHLYSYNEMSFHSVAYTCQQIIENFEISIAKFKSHFDEEEQSYSENDVNNFEEKQKTIEQLIIEEKQLIHEESNLIIHWMPDESIQKMKNEIELDSNSEQAHRLKFYLKNLTPKKNIIDITDYSIFDHVVKNSPHFKEVVNYFKGSFILNHFKMKSDEKYQAPLPILLLGEPGIGKTYFAKDLAKQLNTSSHLIDANSISANFVLTGGSKQWKNGEAGLIFQQMIKSPTVSPIIIIDEIDKLSSGKNYDPFSTFHQLLEPENSKNLFDEFIDCSFDASHIIYILTANSIQHIPDSLLSRMKIIDIQKPTGKDFYFITQHIYRSIIGQSGLFKPKLNMTQLNSLESFSLREVKQILNHSVFTQMANFNMSDPTKVKLNQTLLLQTVKTKKSFGFTR